MNKISKVEDKSKDNNSKGLEQVKKGLLKRSKRRSMGLFIDGVGLDRAARRINRKVDISNLIQGVTSGLTPVVGRYYTLIPYEDDSRHRAYLDAIEKAGLTVVVKRLPPIGINKQVSFDPEMSADMVAFAMGHTKFSELSTLRDASFEESEEQEENQNGFGPLGIMKKNYTLSRNSKTTSAQETKEKLEEKATSLEEDNSAADNKLQADNNIQRVITVVCPSFDTKYALFLAKELGAETVSADFGKYNKGDFLKSASNWIDLSDSETIWRD